MQSLTLPHYLTTGLKGLILVLAISAIIIAVSCYAFGITAYVDWISGFIICAIPFHIITAVLWQNKIPYLHTEATQPKTGLAILLLTLLVAAIIFPILYYVVGRGVMSPILVHFIIQSVGAALLYLIIFEGWPMNKWNLGPIQSALWVLAVTYIIDAAVFYVFYNYSFMEAAPFYNEAADPKGLFGALEALTYAVVVVAGIVLYALLEGFPLHKTNLPQPWRGLIALSLILIASAIVYWLAIDVLGMETITFMTIGPVTIIFGVFIVDHMMQFKLFATHPPTQRRLLKLVVCVASAAIMYYLYDWSVPLLAGKDLLSGNINNFEREIWVATSMLGITFPVINLVAGTFAFWPLVRPKK